MDDKIAPMLNFSDLALRRGTRTLFSHATFVIDAGDRVGITGANGSGKSSLLALVRGELGADAGRFSMPPGLTIAHVAQETRAGAQPALEFVIDGDADLRATQAALADAERDGDGYRQARLHAQLDAIDGYTAEARAARLLDGLGFAPEQIRRPMDTFSGGWRERLSLARALMCRSDLLLLDEPTNHLDLDAVIWLGEWLRSCPATLLLISHDRDFLDQVVNRIVHIEQGGATLYRGNYSAFERQRAQQLAAQQAAHAKQAREIAHMQAFVDRFRAKASKARAAQSRIKALERMVMVAPAHVDSPFRFAFPPPDKVPYPLLQLRGAAAGYGTRAVISGIDLQLAPGDRIGLLGANGAGKSTLIRLLAGEIAPLAGDVMTTDGLRIGYFAQHQIEQLQVGDSPLAHLQRLAPDAGEQGLRDFLGGFGFHGDAATAPVAPLSGGEKARLVLALLVYQRPNLLLLDEPTNHLDLEMRRALALALQDFAGAMIVVSHDRHLLRTVTDDFWRVHEGTVQRFDGDLDDYARGLAEQRRETPARKPAPSRRERRRDEALQREAVAPLRRRFRDLERQLDRLHARRAALEDELADPRLYTQKPKDHVKALLVDKGRLDADITATEAAWLSVGEQIETAGADRRSNARGTRR